MNWTVFLMMALTVTTLSPLLPQMPDLSRSPINEGTRNYDTWVWDELSLTDVQREQIDQIAVSNEESTKAILRNVLTTKLSPQDAIMKGPYDPSPRHQDMRWPSLPCNRPEFTRRSCNF